MKIETQIEKFRVFDILNYWRIRLWKDLYQGCIRVRFTDFRLNLQNIKCIMLVKALGILIGSYLLGQIACIQSVLKKKLICVAISLLTPHQCIT
jgi:hypothetical protein